MVLQSSGVISLSDIRYEFGGASSGTIDLGSYAGSGTYGGQKDSNPNSVPYYTSSGMNFGQFYSASKYNNPGYWWAVEQVAARPSQATNQNAAAKCIYIHSRGQEQANPVQNWPI